MMQASADASRLDRRLQEEQKTDGLTAQLRHWQDAAEGALGALDRVAAALLRDGTPQDQVERVRGRLVHLKERARRFDLLEDLDGCVEHWKALGLELAQLSGRHRDGLVRLLQARKPRIDQTTSILSSARKSGGMAPEKYALARSLQEERDRALHKYERLRTAYLEAERNLLQAERQGAQPAHAREHHENRAPLPNLSAPSPAARKAPMLVRLPVAPPPAKGRTSIAPQQATKPVAEKRGARAGQRVATPPGAARVSLERIERVAGFPTGMDGIGRGGQSAALVLEDAAEKIFRRAEAKAPPNRLPARGGGAVTEHHVARFNHELGSILQEARQARGTQAVKDRLLAHLDRDHRQRASVAGRLEKTLSHLATATHRTLTDRVAGELRRHLARMDAVLARIRGKAAHEVADGASEVSELLQRMGALAAMRGGAGQVADFRRLLEERKGQIKGIVGQSRAGRKLEPPPSQQQHAHLMRDLQALRRTNPGLDTLLKHASQSQLVAELSRAVKHGGLQTVAGKPPRSALGSGALTGGFQALGGSHLGGFGGGHRAGALTVLSGAGGGLGKALEKQLGQQLRAARPQDAAKILAGLGAAPKGTALHELARRAEARQKQRATRHAGRKGPAPSAVTAAALLEVLQQHPKGRSFAAHLAPGGVLRSVCEAAQRGHGLPIGQMAQHYLASRGHSHVFNAVATFNKLVEKGHQPHRWGLGSIGHFVSSQASSALSSVTRSVGSATSSLDNFARTAAEGARQGISSLGNRAFDMGRASLTGIGGIGKSGAGAAGSYLSQRANGLRNAARSFGDSAWGGIRQEAHALSHVARSGFHALQGGASWVQHKAGAARQRAGAAADWQRQKASGSAHWLGEKVHSGLEWARKTGVAGAVGTGLAKGFSSIRKAAEYTPLGLAIKAGKWAAGGGLAKVWDKSKHVAGAAWGGVKSAYKATSSFLQSPAGQLLVTGLSLAATFIPGGLVVKAMVGGGIGAIQAISEGKDWKGVLAGAAGGALSGALPFLKLGPLAKVGVGALTGGITALAQGGSLKDALKGAAGGGLDSFDPGAFKALRRLKGVSGAEKLLKRKNLSKAEKALLEGSKFAGPLRGLEKAMTNPRARRIVGGLEHAGSKAIKGGIWVSGKAARAQGVLDKIVGAGDAVHGVLEEVHQLAPGLAGVLGDNAAGRVVSNAGDWAGKGDEKLSKALAYGHGASDRFSAYRGYLDKGLGFAGVKDPAKAYQKRMARRRLPGVGLHEALGPRNGRHQRARLELAVARGKVLLRKGRRVAQGVHDGLGSVHGVVENGLAGAQLAQSGLEKASGLARAGAGIVGEDSELGKYLAEVAGKADRVHQHLEQGIAFAEDFEKGVGKAQEWSGRIPGVRDGESPLEQATHLEGKRRKKPAAREESGAEKVHGPHRVAGPHGHRGAGDKTQAGRSVGGHLGKMERALGKGLRLGRKVDSGLEKIAGVADRLAKALGDDSELGHLAQQVGEASGKGHDRLHEALGLASKGKRGLHQGRELFEKGLAIAAGEHEKRVKRSPHGHPPPHLVQHGRAFLDDAGHLRDGRQSVHDGEKPDHHGSHLRLDLGHVSGHGGASEAEIAPVVEGAAQWVTGFGKAVSSAIKEIEQLMSAGKTREAGDRVQAVSVTSEQTRFEVTRALSTATRHPALHKQAQSASRHYLEIRRHFFEFVKGLHGLAGRTQKLEGMDGQEHPDLLQLSTDLGSLQVKIDALGDLKHADTPMQGSVAELKKEAAGVRARLAKAQSAHQGDNAAAEIVAGLSSRLQQMERQIGAHGEKRKLARGDKELGIGERHRAASSRERRRKHSAASDFAVGGNLHVDSRRARRDGMDVHDAQDVDSAAMDTWIGSGEGVALFSDVFGAFLPAEGAPLQTARAHTGALGAAGVHLAHGLGGHGASHVGKGAAHRQARAGGFFQGLFQHLHGFADRIAGWSELGGQLLGKGMHHAEMGLRGLSAIEKAAAKVQGMAGKAEGFLGKMGLGKLAGFAGRVGGAASWVDREARILHGGLKNADRWMGKGKKIAGQIEGGAERASFVFDQAEHARFGSLLSLFKASRTGEGVDGRLAPDKVRLGSQFDEPRRLDLTTLSRMEGFLGGSFSGVRVHTGPGAAQVTSRFAAEAVTVRDHIFFAPGRFNPSTVEGQRLLAHELTHVMQKGRPNLDVRTAESEALRSEHTFGYGTPHMETLNLRQAAPDFKLADGEGSGNASGVHTAKRNRSRGHEAGSRDTLPDGEELLEQVSSRVYELLMEELEHSFESR